MRRSAVLLVFIIAAGLRPAAAARSQEELRALELMMSVLVNADRLENDLPMLEYSPDLAGVARAHSADMVKHGFFDHFSPRTGKAGDRIRKARLPAIASAENLVIRDAIAAGQAALMESPGHRENILTADFTHIGIGIVENPKGQLVITQNFMTRIQRMDPKAAPDALLNIINFLREQMDRPPLVMRPTLAQSAFEHSEKIHKAGVMVPADKVKILPTDRRRYRAMRFATFGVGKLEDVLQWEACLEMKYREIGIGTVLNTHENKPPGLLWVTVIIGER